MPVQPSSFLVLTRPYTRKAFHYFADIAFASKKLSFSSEWAGLEADWMMRPFYDNFDSGRSTESLVEGIPPGVLSDVISRCRLLRQLKPNEAKRMVGAMWPAARALLDRHMPEMVVSGYIDCYLYDIIAREQRARGGSYATISSTILPLYGDINYKFHPISVRTPDDDEVDRVQEVFRNRSFLAHGVPRNRTGWHLRKFVTLYARHKARLAWFAMRKIIDRDRLNFHYNTPTTAACQGLGWLRVEQYCNRNWKSVVESSRLPKVFVPLQYYPECRYDYSTGLPAEVRNVPELILKVCEVLSPSHLVVLKEHPSVWGLRNPEYFRKLRRFDNVCLVPTEVMSGEVASMVDCVVTPGSTIGLEQSVRGGRVISIGRPSYFVEGCVEVVRSQDELRTLPERIRAGTPLTAAKEVIARSLVRKQLSQSIPGECRHLAFNGSSGHDQREMRRFAEGFNRFLPDIHRAVLDAPH